MAGPGPDTTGMSERGGLSLLDVLANLGAAGLLGPRPGGAQRSVPRRSSLSQFHLPCRSLFLPEDPFPTPLSTRPRETWIWPRGDDPQLDMGIPLCTVLGG